MSADLKAVAAHCGYSINTVSDILNCGRASLYRQETVRKVRASAEELSYQPNRHAQFVRTRRSHTAGFASINYDARRQVLANYVIYPFIVGLSHGLVKLGYHFAMLELEELGSPDSTTAPQVLRDRYFDGFVVQQPELSLDPSWRRGVETPVVWWDTGLYHPHGTVMRDEVEVGRLLSAGLAKLGHRRMAFCWSASAWQMFCDSRHRTDTPIEPGEAMRPESWRARLHFSLPDRYKGYLTAMADLGVEPCHLILNDPENIARQLKILQPTALLLHRAVMPISLQLGMAEVGWQIPRDLSIATLDLEARIQSDDGISMGGITYDRYETGSLAAEMLVSMIGGQTVPSRKFVGEFRAGATIGSPPSHRP
jgi:DNA-binding LacI/PurR family transcriptional regulator